MTDNISAEVKVSIQTEVFLKNLVDVPETAIEYALNELAKSAESRVKESIRSKGLIRTGALLKSVNSAVANGNVTIGASTFYAPILERGARPHKIKAKDKRFLNWPTARHPVKEVDHPGIRARKFLREPINRMEKSGEIESVFQGAIQTAIRKAGG